LFVTNARNFRLHSPQRVSASNRWTVVAAGRALRCGRPGFNGEYLFPCARRAPMNDLAPFFRAITAACFASLAACSGSDDGGSTGGQDSGPTSDGDHVDSTPADTIVADASSDVAADTTPPGDSSPPDVADTTPPTDTATSKTLVRIFDGDDGAALYVCQA